MSESHFSLDIETNGPAPGLHSMLSLGIAVYEQGTLTGTFSRNLEVLPEAGEDPDTMEWWKTQPRAWAISRLNPEPPEKVMADCAEWIESFPERRIAVAWPAAFDFSFVNYYFWRFVGRNPLGFSCLDLRSYVSGLNRHAGYLGIPESEINSLANNHLPKGLIPHEALSDALQQGALLVGALEFAMANGNTPVPSRGKVAV